MAFSRMRSSIPCASSQSIAFATRKLDLNKGKQEGEKKSQITRVSRIFRYFFSAAAAVGQSSGLQSCHTSQKKDESWHKHTTCVIHTAARPATEPWINKIFVVPCRPSIMSVASDVLSWCWWDKMLMTLRPARMSRTRRSSFIFFLVSKLSRGQ